MLFYANTYLLYKHYIRIKISVNLIFKKNFVGNKFYVQIRKKLIKMFLQFFYIYVLLKL